MPNDKWVRGWRFWVSLLWHEPFVYVWPVFLLLLLGLKMDALSALLLYGR